MYGLVDDYVCTLKFKIDLNSDGNILQEGESVASTKNLTFENISSTITASEIVNDDDSSAIHNGVSGLMWLFSGKDDNFDPLTVRKITRSEIDYE